MDIEQLRDQTPGCAHRVHLNNAGAALMSRTTLAAMTGHLALEAEIGGYEAEAVAADRIQEVYRSLATLVGGRAEEVALFDNSTHAWNAAFYSIDFQPGDQILTGRDEYGSSALAYFQIAERRGAEVIVVPNDRSGQIDVDALRSLVGERTKLIGLTWVPTSGGLVNPAAEVGRIAREAGVLYLLDATQVVGQFPVDVRELGCDLLTGTGRKFLRGPRGTGFLWVSEGALSRLDPFVVEIESAVWDGGRGFRWAPGARRFETWENSYVNFLGLGAAVQQALDLGLEAIGERAFALGDRLREGLQQVPGVSTHDLGTRRCAIVTATVEGIGSEDVMTELAAHKINVSTTSRAHNQFDTEVRDIHPLVRFSPHYYTSEAEIDRAIEVVAGLRAR
jgi:selenocysteine lyase/cysteine desulfurase